MHNNSHSDAPNGFSRFITPAPSSSPAANRSHTSTLEAVNGTNGHGHSQPLKTLADSFLNVANFQFSRGDLKSCIESLRSALEVAPQDPQILITLGNVYFQLSEFKEARAHFEQALQFAPQNAILHVQLATTCERLGDLAGLKTALRQALAIDPACKEGLLLQANVHLQAERFVEAKEIYERLLADEPNHVEWLLLLAKCRFHLGNLGGCRELYERVCRIEPGNPIALEALAIIQNQSKPKSNVISFTSVQDIVRDNPALHRDHNGKPHTMPISGMVANFIQQHIKEGSRTIETGAGLSTLCFLVRGAAHTAIAPDPGMESRLNEYCQAHGMRDDRLTFIPKRSEDAVWAIEGEFDCALIDGGHGFPIPFLDFFYLNRHLKKGGYLLIDDLEIWTGETLAKFLSCEADWKFVVQDGGRAIIFQKIGDAQATEWTHQEYVVKSSLHPAYLQTVIPRGKL